MKRRAFLTVTAAGTVALLAPPAPAATAGGRHRLVGLHDATGTAAGHVGYGSLRLWDAGVSWASIETALGVYDWTRLDQLVDRAAARGVDVTLVVGGRTPEAYGPPNTPPDLEVFRAYATAVMARYGNRISTYSAWNEVNDPQFWGGTPEQMADLCRVLAEVRATVAPGARLLSPSFQTSIPYQRRQLEAFLATSRQLFDAVGVSLYPPVGEGPEAMIRLAGKCRNRMNLAGCPHHMPLWGTEVNYAGETLGPWDQAAYVLRTYLLAATGRLDRIYWYRWDWRHSTLGNTYLTRSDLVTPTLAGRSVQTAIDWLSGDPHPRLLVDDDGTHRLIVATSRARKVIVWNPRRAVHIPTPTGARHLVRLDLTRRRLNGRHRIRVGRRPKLIWAPLR